jgi:putative NADH-flavin reductase
METSVESSDLVAARRLSALRMSVRESNVNIALIGATGFVGSAILREALRRGHEVTAIVRHPEKLPPHSKLHPKQADVSKEENIAQAVEGHDVVISVFNPG